MKNLTKKIRPVSTPTLPSVAVWLDTIRTMFFAAPLLLLVSCGDNATEKAEDRFDEMKGKVEARVDTIQQNMRENRDENFVTDVAEENQEELQLLNLIGSKAWNKELKSHAAKMKKDHEQLARELGEYASSHNINIEVDTLDGAHDLADNKSGADWDKKAIDELINKHEKAVKDFEKAPEKVNDQDLKAWTMKTLPILQQHLSMLQTLKGKMK